MNYIYGLVDPRTKELRYIGKSTNPKQRLYFHIKKTKDRIGSPNHKEAWIKQLLALGLEPELEILEENIKEKDWKEIERWWICMAKVYGYKLVNTTEGGEGFGSGINHYAYGGNFSSIHRENLSKSKTGTSNPMYGKVGGNKGRVFTASHRKNLSVAHMGYVPSQESLKKRSESFKGEKNHQFGKTRSEIHCKRLSEAHKGKNRTEEARSKTSISIMMSLALKKGDIQRVYKLQDRYLRVSGQYNKKYPIPKEASE